jgi:hypothetical protein
VTGNIVSRRKLIRNFIYLVASAALFPGFATTKHRAEISTRKAHENIAYSLGDLISNKPSAAEIGNVYLSQAGPAMDPESLADSIVAAGGGPFATFGETRATVCAQIRSDFARGRTVLVDGWVLSQTEVSIYALVAVTSTS